MTIGLILAGGTSSRFEFGDKALYQNFAERCFSTLSSIPSVDNIFISAKPSNMTQLQTRLPAAKILLDKSPYISQGPLSALYALTSEFYDTFDVLVLSVDNPELSQESLELLLKEPNAYAHDHYTIAHLTLNQSLLADFLSSGQRRVRSFLEQLDAKAIELPENELIDHNKK